MDKIFTVSQTEIEYVLKSFGLEYRFTDFREITRYNYENNDPNSKEVRLILSVKLCDGSGVIIKFLNENEHPQSQIEEQSRFSELLRRFGVNCAQKYSVLSSPTQYTLPLTVGGYSVCATAEAFMPGELKTVTAESAFEIGALIAKAHRVSEENNCHVSGSTLFDPFKENDLFFYNTFEKLANRFPPKLQSLGCKIKDLYKERLRALEPLKTEPAYAVQGDLSNCNLYRTSDGNIGMFDFNNCADNRLLCDTIMQGIFVSRLMDYEEPATPEFNLCLFKSFLRGYCSVREIPPGEWQYVQHLYAVTDAFWGMDIKHGENAFEPVFEQYEKEKDPALLETLSKKLAHIYNSLSGTDRPRGIEKLYDFL